MMAQATKVPPHHERAALSPTRIPEPKTVIISKKFDSLEIIR